MAKMTKYMRAQIREDDWIKIETSHGVQWLEKDVVGVPKEWNGEFVGCFSDYDLWEIFTNHFAIYYTGSATSFEVVHGFGARLSAPGYLDCTDWCVFNTVGEALDHIKELRE